MANAHEQRLIAEKKRAIAATHTTGLEKGDDIGKDLLSNCRMSIHEAPLMSVRANMAADLKPEQRLSDDEVLAQITTFVSHVAFPVVKGAGLMIRCWLETRHPPLRSLGRSTCYRRTPVRKTSCARSAWTSQTTARLCEPPRP